MIKLIDVLNSPDLVINYSQEQWQVLLAQANSSNLIGRLNYFLKIKNIQVPDYVSWHLKSAEIIADRQKQQALREVYELNKVLGNTHCNLTFLKGSAYIVRNLPCSNGRTFADIDVLVTKDSLAQVEFRLKMQHWLKTEVDDYDEQYYRQWMHEIPPLQHVKRGTVLDVHHNILPMTNRNMPNVDAFKLEQINVEGIGTINTLCATDLCIHSSVHLFSESEFQNGLRDISDFDLLLRHFSQDNTNFINELISRAQYLGLYDYVRKSVKFSHMLFNTPLPNNLPSLAHESAVKNHFEQYCFKNIFTPNHSSVANFHTKISRFILYWRGHLMRMPLTLLVPHLIKKSIKRIQDIGKHDDSETQLP